MNYSPELQSALADFTRGMPEDTHEQREDKIRAAQNFALGWLQGENLRLKSDIARLQEKSTS